jgi:flagellin
MLNRMYSLAEQSANGTYNNETDRAQLQKEVEKLRTEIDRIADSSNFNGLKLLDGTMGRTVSGFTPTANSIQSISVMGGGNGSIANLSVSVDANGNVAAGFATAVTGVQWQAVNPATGATGTAGTTSSVGFGHGNGGTMVFKAVVTKATATANNASLYDGMTISVNVAASNGTAYTATSSNAVSVTNGSLTLQIGDTGDTFNQMSVQVNDVHATALSINNVDISTQSGAQTALKTLKDAINYVSDVRGTLGATQNRLEHTINNLSVMQENIQDAESTIRDTDVAAEMMKYTKNSILVQSAQAMLAQANQQPQGVLQLLQ